MNSVSSPAPGAALFNLPKNNKNSLLSAANTAVGTVITNAMNVPKNIMTNAMNVPKKGVNPIHIIILVFLVILVTTFIVFWKQINESLYQFYEYIRKMFGANKDQPIKPSSQERNKDIPLEKPQAPQDTMHNEKDLIEKILPGHNEVYNISKNAYTYYDAEPLCKALNAELATYEQVKEAYGKGADWCNYGWVKGQMAVYPTQKSTWDTLQSGPENERMSCGRPGVNGGFFDNPELKFGVNCYGTKPDQKAHDATAVTSGEGAPLSPGQLKQEKKVAKYRGEMNYISVLPWSKTAWSG